MEIRECVIYYAFIHRIYNDTIIFISLHYLFNRFCITHSYLYIIIIIRYIHGFEIALRNNCASQK